MSAHLVNYFAHPFQETLVVQHWLAHADSITPELTRLSNQARRMGQGAHANRAVVRSHATELVASDERGVRARVRRAECRNHSGRAATDYQYIDHLRSRTSV